MKRILVISFYLLLPLTLFCQLPPCPYCGNNFIIPDSRITCPYISQPWHLKPTNFTPAEYWSDWISEEQSKIAEANAGYYLAGIEINGDNSDNQCFLFRSDYRLRVIGPSSVWSQWFSDEDKDGVTIPEGELITAVRFNGQYADNISIKHSSAGLGLCNRSMASWTSWYSDESDRNKYIAPPGYFIIGWKCRGDYSDDYSFYIAPLK